MQLEKAYASGSNSSSQQQQQNISKPVNTQQPRQQPQQLNVASKSPIPDADIFGSQQSMKQSTAPLKKSSSTTAADNLLGDAFQSMTIQPTSVKPNEATKPVTPQASNNSLFDETSFFASTNNTASLPTRKSTSQLEDLLAPPSLDDMMLGANTTSPQPAMDDMLSMSENTKKEDDFGDFQTTTKPTTTADMSQFDLLIGKQTDEPQEFLSFNETENKSVKILSMFEHTKESTISKNPSPTVNKSSPAMEDFF